MSVANRAVLTLLSARLCLPLLAQAPGQPPVITSTTKEVVVDVVVRDRHGHLVRDLNPVDFEVYEDGVKQKITSFQNIQGKDLIEAEQSTGQPAFTTQPPAPASARAGSALNTLREVNFVSIVLGQIAPGNLAFARNAVKEFIKTGLVPHTYVTVFRADYTLRLLQPFTNNRDALLLAADRATSLHPNGIAGSNSTALNTQALTAAENAPTGPGANPMIQPFFDPNDPSFQSYSGMLDASSSIGVAQLNEAELAARLRFVNDYVNGMTSMDVLSELVRSQAHLSGRKIVFFMSDGLQIPGDAPEKFTGVVSDANRAGVTFYTLDTQGLNVASPVAASVAQLNRAVKESRLTGALASGSLHGGAAFDAASAAEDVELIGSSNTQLPLRVLAESTGGFATSDTNDITAPMRRIMEDIATHYELSYTPTADVYDGRFRKIAVKVDRPRVTIQSRRGYFALPELNGEPIQPFELAALNAINARPQPHAVSYQAELLKFRPYQGGIECAVTFEIPFAGLTPQAGKTGMSHIRVSLMGLIQDPNGQIVQRISRELVRDIPTAKWPEIKQQSIRYSEPVALMPGRYVLSTAVVDNADEKGGAQKSGAKRLAEFVSSTGHVSLSTVEVVDRVEPLTTPPNPLNPFETDGKRFVFTLGDAIPAGKAAPLYFVVYPARDADTTPPKLTLELFKDGKEVGRTSPELPKPDRTGAIPVYAELSPPPGSYEVRVIVTQGAYSAQTNRLLIIQ